MGDPAGIGPEIIARSFRDDPVAMAGCFVAGDVATMRRASACLQVRQPPAFITSEAAGVADGANVADGAYATHDSPHPPVLPVALIESPADLSGVPPGCIPVLQVTAQAGASPGQHPNESGEPGGFGALTPVPWGNVSAQAGRMGGQAVVWAAQAALRGDVAAVVTAPMNKASLALAGPPFDQFPGHTELLQFEAAAFQRLPLAAMPVRMMLANDELRTVLVSIHVSIAQAIQAVTFDAVLQTLQITHSALLKTLGRPPHIGVAGLNPHAGEGGLFGREEIDIIAPAIAAARLQGLHVSGPFAPDTVFMRARAQPGRTGEFDVVIAMYHDQGLIPVKYLGIEKGVNVTLGLPLVRTSPDHGTAFDIAGQGVADASSLLAAVRMAKSMAWST